MVFTDDRGCFKLDKVFKGRAWMWVHFTDKDRTKIRGNRPGFLNNQELIYPLRDPVGTLYGPAFNDIFVKYGMYEDEGTSAHLYWGGATVGNALHEYYDLATTANIDLPKDNLDIYIAPNSQSGFALLSGKDDVIYAFANALGLLTQFNPIVIFLTIAAVILVPDVLVGIDFNDSDRVKKLGYHEFAHCSHFENVTNAYWDDLVWAEIFAGGHGTSSSNDAALIEVCEAWAEFIEHNFAHSTYPVDNSARTATWADDIEHLRNESLNHIPIGYFHDLLDTNSENVEVCDMKGEPSPACGPINDAVSGFTIQDIFGELDATIDSITEFTTNLIAGLPSNTQTAVNNLLGSY